ncbi:MAG: hypothetical protein ABIQ72_14150 [Usitatibacter sp.]
MKKPLALLAAALTLVFATQPLAQKQKDDETVAKLVEVQGSVLVSRDAGLVSGVELQRLLPGTRIITTANSGTIIEYDDGCRVRMKENQRFEVEKDRDCSLLAALPIIDAPAAVGLPLASILIPGAVGAGAVGTIVDSRSNQTVSPS